MNELHISPDREVLVDVSNICRDRDLAPRGTRTAWSRLTRLTEALRDCGAQRITGIADESLRHLLPAADRRRLRDAERDGTVRTVPGSADEELLRLAEQSGALIASGDRFVGHRRLHPWLQGCTDRFLIWETEEHGLRVVAADLGYASALSVSRGEEADLLRERHLDPLRRPSDLEALQHAYRCPDPNCLRSQLSPERLDTLPERTDGRAVCPWCQTELVDLGTRPRGVEVVIEHDGHELGRQTLAEGAEIVLGRAALGRLDGSARVAAGRVSRDHLRLRCQDGMLHVTDARSLNGTSVARWNSMTRALDQVQPLDPGAEVQLGHHDVVVMGAFRVRRSGQQFALASVTADAATPIVPPTAATGEAACG